MARTIAAPALATLLAAEHWHWLRVKVENPDGVLTDVSLVQSVDWLNEVEVTEDVDHPVMAGKLVLRLDTDTLSMAPTMGGSLVNRDALNNYARFLDLARDLTIEVAVTAVGVSPVEADWHGLGEHVIHKISWGDESQSVVILEFRDIGSRILDRWLTRKREFGAATGETLMDAIIRILISGGFLGLIPETPDGEPTAVVFPYEVEPQGTLTAARDLSLRIGWELRYRYDANDDFLFTLYEPPRGNVTPDWTLTVDQYDKITRLEESIEHVRNYVEVEYFDRATGARKRVESRDEPSILKYGERWMEIVEGDDSIIDSPAEAQAMADAASNDLSEPWAAHELEMHLFWPVQLGDVFELPGNLVHYDDAQIFAVVGITHRLAQGHGTTSLQLRGTVSGAYKEWIRRASAGTGAEPTELRLNNFREIERYPTTVKLGWAPQGDIDEIWLWFDTFEQPVTGDPWPTMDSPNPIRLTGDSTEYTANIPRLGQITYALAVPFSKDRVPGRPWQFTIQPSDALPLIFSPSQAAGASGLYRDLSFYVSDPAGLGGTLRVWVNRSSSSDADPTAAVEGTLAIATTDPPFTADASDVFTLTVGGTANLLEDIRVHPGKGKRVFAEFINSAGISSGVQTILLQPGTAPVDDANELIAGIISNYTPFASSIRPYRIFDALPGSGAFVGELVFLTTDSKLYRWNGSAWTTAIATVDLVGTINTAQIADAAITAAKIGNAAVETAKLANEAVDANKIAASAVTTVKVATGAITDTLLAASAVTETKIASDAVTSPKIIAGAITTAKIAAGAVTANEIAALTILAGNIAAGAITTAKIAAGAVTANEIAANTITAGQIAAGTITSTEIAAATITGGDIAANTITAGNIAANTITAAEIAANTITAAQIAANAITSDELAANSVIAGKILAASITATELATDSVTTAKIAAGQVTAAKMNVATLASITDEAGIIVSGKLQNAAGTHYLDLDASGTNGFLVHTRLTLRANGNAEFLGDVTLVTGNLIQWKHSTFIVGKIETFYQSGGPPAFEETGIRATIYNSTGASSTSFRWYWDTLYAHATKGRFVVDGHISAISLTATEDMVTDALAVETIVFMGLDVSIGANDTGDAGFRVLQVPN